MLFLNTYPVMNFQDGKINWVIGKMPSEVMNSWHSSFDKMVLSVKSDRDLKWLSGFLN